MVDEKITAEQIIQSNKKIKKEKFWKVLQFMQDEKIIKIESDGRVLIC